MFLERTISQLDIGPLPPDRATELGMFGYAQWLATLPGAANYHDEVRRARAMAAPFAATSPAVAAFCDLLTASGQMPPRALPLPQTLTKRRRRGGARARRLIS